MIIKQSFMGSIRSALRGFLHAATERSFRLLIVAGIIAITLLAFFAVPVPQRITIIILIIATLAAEIFNTAIEELSDALVQDHHPSIAKVKELTAGAVLLLSLLTFFLTLYYIIGMYY
jgi:diacylglycerol kinase